MGMILGEPVGQTPLMGEVALDLRHHGVAQGSIEDQKLGQFALPVMIGSISGEIGCGDRACRPEGDNGHGVGFVFGHAIDRCTIQPEESLLDVCMGMARMQNLLVAGNGNMGISQERSGICRLASKDRKTVRMSVCWGKLW